MHHRRGFLVALGSAVAAGLAGCSGDGGPTTTAGETTATATTTTTTTTATTTTTTTTGSDAGGPRIPDGIESEPLPEEGDEQFLEGVETFEYDEASHVPADEDIAFETMPPTGGPHYNGVVPAGVYEEPRPLGELVHNLEHGHVVVYHDPTAITPDVTESLRRFVDNNDDFWAAMVAVPTPVEDPDAPYVLTAWGALLRLDGYDARVVRAFLAEYVGRGPENPVR